MWSSGCARRGGKLLYQRKDDNLGRIIEARYVGMMNTMMQETLLTGTARKAELPGWPAAGKTGTSQDFRDAWFIGYTGHLVTGVWLGNDDSSPTKKTTGGGIAGRDLEQVHEGRAPGRAGGRAARRVERAADREPVAVRRLADDAAGAGVQFGRAGAGRVAPTAASTTG